MGSFLFQRKNLPYFEYFVESHFIQSQNDRKIDKISEREGARDKIK